MKTSDFNYHLPPECIAQTPIEPRDQSRLLVLNRDNQTFEDAIFKDIGGYLKDGDLLVINQTRVIPARIFARKPTGGRVELLLLKRLAPDVWEALVGGKRVLPGMTLQVVGGPAVEVLADLGGSRRKVKFLSELEDLLPDVGQMPLPPYIHTALQFRSTTKPSIQGSAFRGCPHAGLHLHAPNDGRSRWASALRGSPCTSGWIPSRLSWKKTRAIMSFTANGAKSPLKPPN
jgi:S-adenosylmethionine:tRNA ribosyltransferase-isomerase